VFEALLSPGGVIGAIVGLSVAALIDRLFPSNAQGATVFYAGLVAAGFLVGVIVESRSERK
jgi:high-affinity Fe2+/Pb2+ permease